MAGIRDIITEDEKRKKKEKEQAKRLGRISVEKTSSRQYEHAKVEDIVSRMKHRYDARGYGRTKGRGAELKEKVTGRTAIELDQRMPSDLAFSPGFSGFVGKIHKTFGFFNGLTNRVSGYSLARGLPSNLEKANMNYSTKQYVGMSVVASFFTAIFVFLLSGLVVFLTFSSSLSELAASITSPSTPLFALVAAQGIDSGLVTMAVMYGIELLLVLLLTFIAFVFSLLVAFQFPGNTAQKRGKAIDKELPFALRHMATEVKAGIGVHKTMKSLVEADYGELSVEFDRTLREIEKGVSTDDALVAMSERSPSYNLSKALMHVVRTLKTGGNLSEIIQTLASEVSFELRMKMRDFVERLNLIGLFYMMLGIEFPVFIAVLAGIFNAIPTIGLAGVLGTEALFLIYFLLIPMGLSLILYLINVMQPM